MEPICECGATATVRVPVGANTYEDWCEMCHDKSDEDWCAECHDWYERCQHKGAEDCQKKLNDIPRRKLTILPKKKEPKMPKPKLILKRKPKQESVDVTKAVDVSKNMRWLLSQPPQQQLILDRLWKDMNLDLADNFFVETLCAGHYWRSFKHLPEDTKYMWSLEWYDQDNQDKFKLWETYVGHKLDNWPTYTALVQPTPELALKESYRTGRPVAVGSETGIICCAPGVKSLKDCVGVAEVRERK